MPACPSCKFGRGQNPAWKGLLQIHIHNKVSVGLQQPLFVRKYSYKLENLAAVLQVQSPYRYLCSGWQGCTTKNFMAWIFGGSENSNDQFQGYL